MTRLLARAQAPEFVGQLGRVGRLFTPTRRP